MPVRKFRSLQEAEDALWRAPGDPALWRAMRSVWRFAARSCPRHFPPGVHRHATLEAAQGLREQWEAEDFRRFWERQRAASQG
jgi:hypothetical protein